MAEQLHQGDAAELERLGLIRYVGSDDDAFGFELTDAGRRYSPILARLAADGVPVLDLCPHCNATLSYGEQETPVDERLLRFAKALTAIAHTTNHCGAEYTALSEVAEAVLREVLPEACEVEGVTCGITIQHEPSMVAAMLRAPGVFVPHGSNTTQVAPQEPANLSDNAPGVALPHSRPRCRKESGMCAMTPDGAGNPATGICPECGVDCGSAGVSASDGETARAAMTSTTAKE